jgi:hypothetical protein
MHGREYSAAFCMHQASKAYLPAYLAPLLKKRGGKRLGLSVVGGHWERVYVTLPPSWPASALACPDKAYMRALLKDKLSTAELMNILPNYENKYNNLTVKANRIISKFKINSILYKIDIDLTLGGFESQKLLSRKDGLTKVLEIAIDRWQNICDKIDKIEQDVEEDL